MKTSGGISDWLNKQHEWIKEAAHLLLTKGQLDDKDIERLVAIAKQPEPKKKTPRTFPKLGESISDTPELRLESIGPVTGIDALNPRKPLEFGTGNLAVVYGANGSGKSGYTRIITKACGKPHSAHLKPNVYTGPPSKQECPFTYTVGGQKKQVVWQANADLVEDLAHLDVFDSEFGRLYLEKDNELSYEPQELALFTNLVELCKRVEKALKTEQQALVSKLPEIPLQHANTEAGKYYSSIPTTSLVEVISNLQIWTKDDQDTLKTCRERIEVADPAAAARKKRSEKAQVDSIVTGLNEGIGALDRKALEALARLKEDAETKRRAAKEGVSALENAAPLDGVGTSTWKAMWEAARDYSTSEAYPGVNFPQIEGGARCVLCQQELDDQAVRRLSNFEEYVMGTLETHATDAESKFAEELKRIPTRPSPEALTTACQSAGLDEQALTEVEAAWSRIEPHLAALRTGELPEQATLIETDTRALLSQLEILSTEAANKAAALDVDAANPDRKEALAQISELEGKKWVSEQATAVQAEVDRRQKLEEYDKWINKTSTKGISRKAGELSETLITKAYVRRFNDELKKLGARRIQVELKKTGTNYGKSKHGIRLRDAKDKKAEVSEVLSEGERRIVALAAFIAEVTGRGARTPFVFDDPISSLDQVFEEKVIARLIELSKDRQVLVFTHRLSFLGIMNDLAGGGLNDVHIRREPWGTGEPGEVPLFGKRPDKALIDLKGERVAKARKVFKEDGYDDYYPLAKAICSDFRILTERIVETVFLADVVQRHRRAVNTKNKIGNLAKIAKQDCELIDEMMTKYSCYEHSQSDEAPVDVPEPDEIEKDIDRMISWHTEFTKRAT